MAKVVSRTVEICLFKMMPDVPCYLLLKRSRDETLYPGMWQFITGTVRNRERAEDAARREIHEETGLTIVRFWVVPFVSTFYAATDDAVHLSPFFAAEVEASAQPTLSHEHEEYEWCSRTEAERKLVWPGQRQGLSIVHDYVVGRQEASRLLSLPV